jgi:hypothetical protein
MRFPATSKAALFEREVCPAGASGSRRMSRKKPVMPSKSWVVTPTVTPECGPVDTTVKRAPHRACRAGPADRRPEVTEHGTGIQQWPPHGHPGHRSCHYDSFSNRRLILTQCTLAETTLRCHMKALGCHRNPSHSWSNCIVSSTPE